MATSQHIIKQNNELQEKINQLQEDNLLLKGEIQDLEDILERTEKGTVFLKGLLNNLSEQNKIYKQQFIKFRKIFTQEQYIFFVFIALLYMYSIYIKTQFPLVLMLLFVSVSKYSEFYFNSINYSEFIEKIESIESTIDPLHELIDSN